MPAFDRAPATDPEFVEEYERGVGWLAHPEETGRRASHAVAGDDGVWVLDPLDAPGVDDRVADLGDVAGVAVLSDYHVRDAAAVAERHDVPVTVPAWLDRAAALVDGPVERATDELGDSGLRLRQCAPVPAWNEAVAYRESDGTLYVPDALGTGPTFLAGGERLGVYLLVRLAPPRATFADVSPERVLVGHGTGVFEDADAALADALAGARRRFPAALRENGTGPLRTLYAALRD